MDQETINICEHLNSNCIPLPEDLWGTNFFPDIEWCFVVFADDDAVLFCSRDKFLGKGIYSMSTSSLNLSE